MIGQTLNECHIENKIAISTTGTIYKATDTILQIPRAVKIIHSELLGENANTRRIRLSLEAWARLDHPNFAHIFAAIDQEGILGFVMDFIEGMTLRRLLAKQSKLGIAQAVDYFLQLARAIDFAHDYQIIHRKLSPENIKICKGETVKIMGLGAMRDLTTSRATPENLCIGKVKYMPQEQFEGEYSIYTDQYTLGAILYEMVTGHAPFEAKNIPDFYRQHMSKDPVPPQQYTPEVTGDLQTIILKMLAKQPQNRFASLKHVMQALIEATDRVDFSGDASVHSLMHRGRQALERRKLENAVYFFNKVLAIYGFQAPYHQEAYEKRELALSLLQEEDDIRRIRELTQKALEHFDDEEMEPAQEVVSEIIEVMRSYQESSRIRGLRMDLCREMPDIVEQASAYLDEQLAKAKELTESACAFLEEKQFSDAIDLLKQAQRFDSKSEKIEQLLALARKKQAIFQAIHDYRDGLSALQGQKYAQAIACFEKFLQIRPDNCRVQKLLKAAQEKEESHKQLHQKIKQIYEHGRRLYEKWEYAQAMFKFEEVLELDDAHPGAKDHIKLINERLKEDTRMEDISFFYRQGMGFFEQQKWKEAIACFNHVLQVMNTHKKALEYKDFAEQSLQKEEIFSRVIEDAITLFDGNKFEQALERFNYLADLDDNNREVQKYRKLCQEFLSDQNSEIMR